MGDLRILRHLRCQLRSSQIYSLLWLELLQDNINIMGLGTYLSSALDTPASPQLAGAPTSPHHDHLRLTGERRVLHTSTTRVLDIIQGLQLPFRGEDAMVEPQVHLPSVFFSVFHLLLDAMAFCLSNCHDELTGQATNEFAFLLLSLSFALVGFWYVMSLERMEGNSSANSLFTHVSQINREKRKALFGWQRHRSALTKRL